MHNPALGPQVLLFIDLVRTYSYFIIFILVFVEGPATIFLSGFLISLGYLDPIPTFFTAVGSDLFGDIVYYSLGRWWLKDVSEKVLRFFRINQKSFDKLKLVFIGNEGSIMFFGKLSSFVGAAAMYVAGLVKVSLPEFIAINTVGAIFKTILLILAGYYLGGAVLKMGGSLSLTTSFGLLFISATMFGFYLMIRSLANKHIRDSR